MGTIERIFFWPTIVASVMIAVVAVVVMSTSVLAEAPVEGEEFDVCGTLLGEGELCDWPVADPDEVPDSDFLYDPPILPDPTLPAPGDECGLDDETLCAGGEQTDSGDDTEPGCPIVVGNGVLCTGPVEAEMPAVDGEVDDESGDSELGGTEVEPGCELPVNEGVIGCGPDIPGQDTPVPPVELPVGGQEETIRVLFVPALMVHP